MWPRRLKPSIIPFSPPLVLRRSLRSNPWSKGNKASLRQRSPRAARPQGGVPPSSTNRPNDAAPSSHSDSSTLAESLSATLHDTNPENNSLLAPVHIPEDPNAVLKERHPAAGILANSGLVVQRQLEMMNVLLGFEQANRYVILDAQGNHVGYMAEQEKGIGSMMTRQWFRTHRSFVTHVFDRHQNEVLRFHRPFSWINSKIRVYDPLEVADVALSHSTGLQTTSQDALVSAAGGEAKVSSLDLSQMRVVGEAQQQWAPLRRKYNLFLFHENPNPETNLGSEPISLPDSNLSQSQQLQVARASQSPSGGGAFGQFAYVDEPFLSWDFSLLSANSQLIGSVNRNFGGFAREIFTDTGVYALRMDSAGLVEEGGQRHLVSQTHKSVAQTTGMTLDQRAVMLATAVSIDFDYFSRHSNSSGLGFFPFFGMGGGGGEAAAGGAAAGGAVEGAATGEVAERVAAGAAGAGAMAGYESMSRGTSENQQVQEIPPEQAPPADSADPWSNPDDSYWGNQQHHGDEGHPGADEGGEAEDGGGGDGDDWDFF
ncbi:hypothetical protein AJ80_07684 [Polytolypa hystricis UAMH7299]|uniref:Scramblase n=1 Tax=Polytolypa hystricis (strain UAMH7299) TaxID=1447883 RepID=A0A2B7XKE6_POLH7|nr:hypothetical protein AJ80_07684 [Polytolypa hystricis UAMH7299]